jgi:SPOR domain
MFVKDRHSGARNWAPGLFATFWILLAAFSAAYLFRVISEPVTARTAQFGADSSAAATPPAASDEQTAAIAEAGEARDREIAGLKTSLRDLAQQVEDLKTRLKPIEKVIGPVAALPPGSGMTTAHPPAAAVTAAPPPPGAVTTSPPTPEPVKPAEQSKPPEKPAEPAKAAEKPATPPKPVEQAKAPEKPAEPAKPDAKPAEVPPAVAVAPAASDQKPPEKPAEKPSTPVQVTSNEPASAPSPAPDTHSLGTPLPIPPGTTRFGIEIGSVDKQDGLRPLWRDLLTNHAALVAGLQAKRVLAPDKKWRLVAGPFGNVAEATQACGLFKKASLPCEATVFAGDSL